MTIDMTFETRQKLFTKEAYEDGKAEGKAMLLKAMLKDGTITIEKAAEGEGIVDQGKKLVGKITKATEEGLEALEKKIAKAFNLEIKDGKPVKKLNIEELWNSTKEASEKLANDLSGKRATVEEKIKNIKLLSPEDLVTKAYNAVKNNKLAWGGAALGATLLALLYIFKGDKKN